MERPLETHFPILSIEQDCILSKQGDITVAYQADLPEIFTLSDGNTKPSIRYGSRPSNHFPSTASYTNRIGLLTVSIKLAFQKLIKVFCIEAANAFFMSVPF